MNLSTLMPKLANFFYKISPRLGFSLQYFHHRKRLPNLKHPKDFSEVIGHDIITRKILEFSEYADKLVVRNHLSSWGLSEYLPEIYRVWDKAEDIDLNGLPEKYIIKTNHGSGGHIINNGYGIPSIDKIKAHFKKALENKYNDITEPHYNKINPKVFCEEFIDDGNKIPTDYKFMCMDGKIKAILLCFDRDSNVHKLVYDTNWEKLPYIQGESFVDKDYSKPKNFELMKDIVSKIAQKFEQVRIDLYNANGKIYIGELTFTADGGILRNFTYDAIKKMGRQ